MSESLSSRVAQTYGAFCDSFERYLILATVLGLCVGIYIAKYFQGFSAYVNAIMTGFVEGYDSIAPLVIFLVLTPSLAKMFLAGTESRFGGFVLRWFLVRKCLACLWAILFTVLLFDFPVMPEKTPSFISAMLLTLESMGDVAISSPYFWSMYISVLVAVIASKIQSLYRVLDNILQSVETAARYFFPIIPLFMIAIGAYIFGLPDYIDLQMGIEESADGVLTPFLLFGTELDPGNSEQMVYIYFIVALLTGVSCIMWHSALLCYVKKRVDKFSIRNYFLGYWIKIYPLLWSTSSESLATPLNLYLSSKNASWLNESVRRFVIGLGSYMNINGTLICTYVVCGMVLKVIDVEVSLVEFLLTVPVVILISYGVPGMPGELIMFAGPLGILLNLPDSAHSVFLALYIGMQVGLPDSFRTGNNSTDDFLCSIILDDIYKKEFKGEKLMPL